jgi:hypothetical protein
MNATFSHNGAAYTVRAITKEENQQAINIALDVCELLAKKRGWDISPEKRHLSSSYPYSVYSEAHDYAVFYLVTTIEGTPSHAVAASILDVIDVSIFEQWSKDMHAQPDVRQGWLESFKQVNKVETDPQAESGEVSAESD